MCRHLQKIGRLVQEDLNFQDLAYLSLDPKARMPRPLPNLVEAMFSYDSL